MKKIFMLILTAFLASGCSLVDSESHVDFKLNIDGVEVNYPSPHEAGINDYTVYKRGDLIYVEASDGNLDEEGVTFQMQLIFAASGKFVFGSLKFNSYDNGGPVYNNFIHSPSDYFEVINFSLDEATKKVKIKFAGKLYLNDESLESESREIQGDLSMKYLEDTYEQILIIGGGPGVYCRADINSIPWRARFRRTFNNIFTSEDAYKIEPHFANTPAPGNFTFSSSSTDNYIRVSKYNPITNSYDSYNVTGTMATAYRDSVGINDYYYVGTFSFTAVNPNNPADIIQATNGEIGIYEHY